LLKKSMQGSHPQIVEEQDHLPFKPPETSTERAAHSFYKSFLHSKQMTRSPGTMAVSLPGGAV